MESREISQLGGLLEFQIVAYELTDESSIAYTQVTVAIIDLNDNKPTFSSNEYYLNISPSSVVGASLSLIKDSIHVFDLDKGINDSFSLFITENENLSESFEVIPKMALNDANLVVKLTNSKGLIEKMGSVQHCKVG